MFGKIKATFKQWQKLKACRSEYYTNIGSLAFPKGTISLKNIRGMVLAYAPHAENKLVEGFETEENEHYFHGVHHAADFFCVGVLAVGP